MRRGNTFKALLFQLCGQYLAFLCGQYWGFLCDSLIKTKRLQVMLKNQTVPMSTRGCGCRMVLTPDFGRNWIWAVSNVGRHCVFSHNEFARGEILPQRGEQKFCVSWLAFLWTSENSEKILISSFLFTFKLKTVTTSSQKLHSWYMSLLTTIAIAGGKIHHCNFGELFFQKGHHWSSTGREQPSQCALPPNPSGQTLHKGPLPGTNDFNPVSLRFSNAICKV